MAAVTGPPAVASFSDRVTAYVAPEKTTFTSVGSALATAAGNVGTLVTTKSANTDANYEAAFAEQGAGGAGTWKPKNEAGALTSTDATSYVTKGCPNKASLISMAGNAASATVFDATKTLVASCTWEKML